MTELREQGKIASARRHGVSLTDGWSASLRANADALTLDSHGIRWTSHIGEQSIAYSDIISVRLQSIPRSSCPDVALCILNFRNGGDLTVTSHSPYGVYNPDCSRAYREFVTELHQRLQAGRFIGISYVRGSLSHRRPIFVAATIALLVMGAALPLAILVQNWPLILVAIGGAGFVWFFLRHAQDNAPRHYRPDKIPPELMPG